MAQVLTNNDTSNCSTWQSLRNVVTMALRSIQDQINGNLQFGLNIAAAGPYSVKFVTPNAPVTVPHNLGKIPTGFIVVSRSAAIIAYQSPGTTYEWQQKTIFISANGVGTVLIYVV